MLRYILAALAALVLLTASLIPDDAYARGGRGGGGYRGGGGGYRGGAVAVRGARGGAVAVRGGRVAGGYRGYGYRAAIAVTGIGATVSVRRRWVPLRSARLRRGPTTAAAAAMMPMATIFARTVTNPHRGGHDKSQPCGVEPSVVPGSERLPRPRLSRRSLPSLDQREEPPPSGFEPRTLTGRRGPNSRSIVIRTRRSASSPSLHFVLPVLISSPMRHCHFQTPGSTGSISYSTPLYSIV